MGEAIPLKVQNLRLAAMPPKVAKQIGTPRSPDPILRRLRADREEKRVTHGRDRADIHVIGTRNALHPTTPIREASK